VVLHPRGRGRLGGKTDAGNREEETEGNNTRAMMDGHGWLR
jgi:hypothetical protein